MYYPESATIAAKWPQWHESIRKIDELLAKNHSMLLTRDFLNSFVNESQRSIDSILQAFIDEGVLSDVDAVACPTHPTSIQEFSSDVFECDLCDGTVQQPARLIAVRAKAPSESSQIGPHEFPPSDFRFDVAISFAGDGKRDRIRDIAVLLQNELGKGRVFFDEFFEAEIAGHDADTYLQNIYRKQTNLVVSCVCRRYDEKPWTKAEWRAIRAFISDHRNLEDRFRFLPIRFGDGEVDGIFSELDIVPDKRNADPREIALLILERLRIVRKQPVAPSTLIEPEQGKRKQKLHFVSKVRQWILSLSSITRLLLGGFALLAMITVVFLIPSRSIQGLVEIDGLKVTSGRVTDVETNASAQVDTEGRFELSGADRKSKQLRLDINVSAPVTHNELGYLAIVDDGWIRIDLKSKRRKTLDLLTEIFNPLVQHLISQGTVASPFDALSDGDLVQLSGIVQEPPEFNTLVFKESRIVNEKRYNVEIKVSGNEIKDLYKGAKLTLAAKYKGTKLLSSRDVFNHIQVIFENARVTNVE